MALKTMTDSNIGPTEVSFEVRGTTEFATLHANTFREAMRERDALRAENEEYASQITTLEWQLSEATKENERLTLADKQWADHVKRLSEENEQLRAEVQRALEDPTQNEHDLYDEVQRLRAALPQPTENLSLWQVRYREWREAGMPDESSQS